MLCFADHLAVAEDSIEHIHVSAVVTSKPPPVTFGWLYFVHRVAVDVLAV